MSENIVQGPEDFNPFIFQWSLGMVVSQIALTVIQSQQVTYNEKTVNTGPVFYSCWIMKGGRDGIFP